MRHLQVEVILVIATQSDFDETVEVESLATPWCVAHYFVSFQLAKPLQPY